MDQALRKGGEVFLALAKIRPCGLDRMMNYLDGGIGEKLPGKDQAARTGGGIGSRAVRDGRCTTARHGQQAERQVPPAREVPISVAHPAPWCQPWQEERLTPVVIGNQTSRTATRTNKA